MVDIGIVQMTKLLQHFTRVDVKKSSLIKNTILETIIHNDIVYVLSLVNNIYTHSIVLCMVYLYLCINNLMIETTDGLWTRPLNG